VRFFYSNEIINVKRNYAFRRLVIAYEKERRRSKDITYEIHTHSLSIIHSQLSEEMRNEQKSKT
jgi:hypothetical protein